MSSRSPDDLLPEARDRWFELSDRCTAEGFPVFLTWTLRTPFEQDPEVRKASAPASVRVR